MIAPLVENAMATILLVDDDPGFLRVLSQMLAGYPNQLFATSGADGLRLARDARPDLILLDLEMPVFGGLDFCRILKANPRLAEVPVIFVTSHSQIPVAVEVFQVGASDFVTKPVNRQKLLAAVGTFLRRPPFAPAKKIEIGVWPEIEGIEPDTLRAQIGGDAKLFMQLLHNLIDNYADVSPMAASVEADSVATFCVRMHGLKGAAGTLGARKLFDLASLAEAIGLAGDLPEFRRLTSAITEELSRLGVAIAKAEATTEAEASRTAPPKPAKGEGLSLHHLANSLRQQSLAALNDFEAAGGQLDTALGKALADTARAHVAQLRFRDAATLLDASDPDRMAGWPAAANDPMSAASPNR